MAGILDYQRNPSFLPTTIDGSMPSLPKQGGGLLGWFNDDPGAMDGASSGRAPLSGNQKQSLLFSGISDAFDSLQGRSGDLTQQMAKQYAQDYTKQSAERRKAAVNQAISAAYAKGDTNGVRQAILQADPADVAHIMQAMSFGQPKIQDIGGAGYSTDPFTGDLSKVVAAKPKAPLISNGMQSSDNGATWSPIPGYVDQQHAIAVGRRAPPKPATGGPLGNPASLFGGR